MKSPNEFESDGVEMAHEEAVMTNAAERYVLGELSPEARDAYEAHFFACRDCADEMLAASKLVEGLRLEEEAPREVPVKETRPVIQMPQPARAKWYRTPAIGYAVAATLAAVLAYQSLVAIPGLRRQLENAQQPLALTSFNLTTLGSRSVPEVSIAPGDTQPYVLLVTIPPDPPARSYEIAFVSAGGKEALRVPVTAEQARDVVQILVPPDTLSPGKYRMVTEGISGSGERIEITANEFTVQ